MSATTTTQSYAALKGLLLILAIAVMLGGLLVIFATTSFLGFITAQPVFAPPSWTLLLYKALGVVALTFAYLLYMASRDPARYVVCINAFILLLVLTVALQLYALFAYSLATLVPAWIAWTSLAARAILAIVLLFLYPRQEQ